MAALASSNIIPVLLVLFTCFRTCLSDSTIFSLPSECRVPANLNAWWSPLVPNIGADPCQLHQNLEDQGIFTTCCMGNQLLNVGISNCGPCTKDMYNLAVACMACGDKNLSSSPFVPTMDNVTTIGLVTAQPFTIPTFSEFGIGNRTLDQYPFPIPPWTNASLNQDLFDPQAVVNLAILSSEPATTDSINPAATTVTTPTTNSKSFEPATTSTPANTTRPTANPRVTTSPLSGSRLAAAIGGVTLGIIVVLVPVVIAFLLIRRRRTSRNARRAQLAQMMNHVGWRRTVISMDVEATS